MNCLIIIDLQNDFVSPNGSLYVPTSEQLIPIVNKLMNSFDNVILTRDWHPPGHISFASSWPGHKIGDKVRTDYGVLQELWPIHCVRGTWGAEFDKNLMITPVKNIIEKGVEINVDSYSAFLDNNHKYSTGLNEWLRSRNINNLYIMGVATDFCVKYTCLDALVLGYNVNLLYDATRAINDPLVTFRELKSQGVKLYSFKDYL